MLEGKTKFILPSKGSTGVIYIPADVVKDSSFPFKPDQEVIVRINDRKLIIERRNRT
jgi:antitoxin component of MazEF toxin-antitoxin module